MKLLFYHLHISSFFPSNQINVSDRNLKSYLANYPWPLSYTVNVKASPQIWDQNNIECLKNNKPAHNRGEG